VKHTRRPDRRDHTRPRIVWSITDAVIENPVLREAQFHDLLKAGFGGVAAFVRCSRYSWDDPLAIEACRHIGDLCTTNGMSCWLGPDPRFVSHKLTSDSSGLELLLFGNAARGDIVPNTATIQGGRYSIRCSLSPRHVHTLTDTAVEFYPLGLARVYAFRRGMTRMGGKDLVDITRDARQYYNARDRYVEAFGSVPAEIDDQWSVLAFFHVRTNHVDFSSRLHLQRYAKLLARLKTAGCSPDGIMWDEPGYTCVYGALPYSPAIRKSYLARRKAPLDRELWKIVFEPDDRSEVPVRLAYFRSVQNSILDAELKLQKVARRLWGLRTALGIHDTWHFESADMCDMNHGSLDLWKTARAKSGGFVDLGGVGALRDASSSHYSNLAALSVIAASLGKTTKSRVAYNNLWTVGDDDGQGWQRESMEHCVKIMALFGTRWIAHAYGPAGTVGQERTFLGSPPLPGYPDHSTWSSFPAWNALLSSELRKAGQVLPQSNLLLVFPVETLYALADHRADRAAADIFSLLLSLLDAHFHVDVLSTLAVQHGHWKKNRFCLGTGKYDFVLFPYPGIIGRSLLRLSRQATKQWAFVFDRPTLFEDGKKVPTPAQMGLSGIDEVSNRLQSLPGLRPVQAPRNCWVTITSAKQGTIVSLAPSRVGYRFGGEVRFNGQTIVLEETEQLQRIFYPIAGVPQRL
jgi:hypothetical protein